MFCVIVIVFLYVFMKESIYFFVFWFNYYLNLFFCNNLLDVFGLYELDLYLWSGNKFFLNVLRIGCIYFYDNLIFF